MRARYRDSYHKSLIYILGISDDTRRHFDEIYDLKSGYIKPDCLKAGWITSGSACAVRLDVGICPSVNRTIFCLCFIIICASREFVSAFPSAVFSFSNVFNMSWHFQSSYHKFDHK